ncbi:hypothetical protein EBO15_16700 [Actinomadura harenae]|uniref:Uncharacterized protein n=1 Tax=Actinomadura harenae TaxID=2483351 RepID=A0A3M2M0V3_9ACTN|nr:hypothetical protein EBO15_16700 [Actinomadura harenae]
MEVARLSETVVGVRTSKEDPHGPRLAPAPAVARRAQGGCPYGLPLSASSPHPGS